MSKWIRSRSKLRGSRAVYKVNLLLLKIKISFAYFKYFLYSRIALKVEYNEDLRKTWNGVEVLLHHSSSKLEFKSFFFSGNLASDTIISEIFDNSYKFFTKRPIRCGKKVNPGVLKKVTASQPMLYFKCLGKGKFRNLGIQADKIQFLKKNKKLAACMDFRDTRIFSSNDGSAAGYI